MNRQTHKSDESARYFVPAFINKVKIFNAESTDILEYKINNFLAENNVVVVSIANSILNSRFSITYYATLVYMAEKD